MAKRETLEKRLILAARLHAKAAEYPDQTSFITSAAKEHGLNIWSIRKWMRGHNIPRTDETRKTLATILGFPDFNAVLTAPMSPLEEDAYGVLLDRRTREKSKPHAKPRATLPAIRKEPEVHRPEPEVQFRRQHEIHLEAIENGKYRARISVDVDLDLTEVAALLSLIREKPNHDPN